MISPSLAHPVPLDAEPPDKVPVRIVQLDLPTFEQEGDFWCWAACIALFLGQRPLNGLREQSFVVLNAGIPGVARGCVAALPPGRSCDLPIQPKAAHPIWQRLVDQHVKQHAGRLPGAQDELWEGRALHLIYERHAVIVDGWRQNRNGTIDVHVLDPRDGSAGWRGEAALDGDDVDGPCVFTLFRLPKR